MASDPRCRRWLSHAQSRTPQHLSRLYERHTREVTALFGTHKLHGAKIAIGIGPLLF
jgi:hypothetical protein